MLSKLKSVLNVESTRRDSDPGQRQTGEDKYLHPFFVLPPILRDHNADPENSEPWK